MKAKAGTGTRHDHKSGGWYVKFGRLWYVQSLSGNFAWLCTAKECRNWLEGAILDGYGRHA